MLGAVDDQVVKYRLLEALRAGEPGRTEARRDAMRVVATRFPGALREWECASPAELARRRTAAEALSARLRGHAQAAIGDLDAPELRWLRWTIRVHDALTRALLARRAEPGAARRGAGTRISAEVHEEVARAEGVSLATLKSALFPSSTRASLEGAA